MALLEMHQQKRALAAQVKALQVAQPARGSLPGGPAHTRGGRPPVRMGLSFGPSTSAGMSRSLLHRLESGAAFKSSEDL
eukprot:326632-Chlamydomonas_euryale.AAC.1